jgi:hypothetical protein
LWQQIHFKNPIYLAPMKRKPSSIFADKDRLIREAAALRLRAQFLRPGEKRDDLLRRARQFETAANIESWVTSRGLEPPKKPN